jgi:Holliday junction resolvase
LAKRKRIAETGAIDLSQIESGELFELLCSDLLKTIGLRVLRPPGRGPDRGVDIIALSTTTDELGFEIESRIAIECKHYARSGRSVTEGDVGNIIERALNNNCDRYLLITSTIPSSTLLHQIEGINNNPSIPLKANIWNSADIRKLLQQHPDVAQRYFGPKRLNVAPTDAKSNSLDLAEQIIAVHLHPDFKDELLELLDSWNEAQGDLKFIAVRPPRELETRLLADKSAIR